MAAAATAAAVMPATATRSVLSPHQIRWLMHYVRGMVAHYMAAVQHVLGNREAQADCYHAQVHQTHQLRRGEGSCPLAQSALWTAAPNRLATLHCKGAAPCCCASPQSWLHFQAACVHACSTAFPRLYPTAPLTPFSLCFLLGAALRCAVPRAVLCHAMLCRCTLPRSKRTCSSWSRPCQTTLWATPCLRAAP